MKRHSRTDIQRDERLRIARTRISIARKDKQYDPNKPYRKSPKFLGYRYITAPKRICLRAHADHNALINFLERIRVYYLDDKIRLDFTKCNHISAPAIVYLYANLNILRDTEGAKLIRVYEDSARGNVKAALVTSGLIDMLKNMEQEPDFSSTKQPPVFSGNVSKHDEILDYIQKSIYKGKLPPEEENRLGDAISETFLNVEDHAYPTSHFPGIESRTWWAICSVIDHQLWLAIYDCGVGIPNTITEDHWAIKSIKKVAPGQLTLLINDDADKIELAMMEGQNRRKATKHGQGSASMHALVQQNPKGELWVYSNHGRYNWFRDSNSKPTNKKAKYVKSLRGTLVQWNIAIKYDYA